ncbi:siroheme synthase [includes: uroporphyrinogen-III C-methyltransferase; precorrin-2 dehydrogenase;sirohydrochlorin ferrochelatase] [Escherichia coli]|uniref:Siroheme synthase [includes: uroporphyrinogen-III C-methyltransferase precorrin-2 dehydrogenasesirohydrochlorin ferrochelatase] n=1 Tax=Escherichia coli TaxID=562 RepID=A0A376MJU5_ECOLX|nr:siroheme synthase [includes: uroporphyrinogen-III C-methyltransferase; precorrin-2 dehydrogenase;sirohydrochlorin ferrochelatase] [Escherichia coli]
MGLNQAATIQQKLIEHGMPGEMPVAIVENGTAVTQRVIDGTLTQLGETGAANEQSIANYYWSGCWPAR